MADAVKFTVNSREFSAALRQYVLLSKRDIPTICNTKAFYIARRAVVETPAVKPGEIRSFIRRGSGAAIGKIINARRGKRGEKGLYGEAMAEMVATVLAARLRSRAFLKSGWLWAVKKLAPYAEKIGARNPRGAKVYGKAKGDAVPATQGWRVTAKIINTTTAAWDKRDGAGEIATPALQRAIDFESKSMLAYIEKKLRQSAQRSGIRTN